MAAASYKDIQVKSPDEDITPVPRPSGQWPKYQTKKERITGRKFPNCVRFMQEVITMKTYMANPDQLEKKWYVVDASGKTLGRLASEVAKVLRGKNKPEFTPFVDTGDYVIVVNCEKIKVTGKKLDQKVYYRHSEYVGSLKETTLKEMLAKHPERVIKLAVQGMLPKGPLGRQMLTKLHVYAGAEHPHAAQKPEELTF
jgi:large subunit ribosomal protein L13